MSDPKDHQKALEWLAALSREFFPSASLSISIKAAEAWLRVHTEEPETDG